MQDVVGVVKFSIQGLVRFCPPCGDENISGTGTSLVIPVHASQHITVEHVDSKTCRGFHKDLHVVMAFV